MSLLAAAFATARQQRRAVLIGYLPAGFPSEQGAVQAMRAMVEAGVDVVEVGLPYSDPLMDGPVIQQAVDAALRAGSTTAGVLRTAGAVAALGVPAVVMSYWNPIERYGPARFADDLAAAGGAGCITPDLIPDEAGDWLAATGAAQIDPVFLVAPSSSDARITRVGETSRGFVYAASTMGVTGARGEVSSGAATLVARVRGLIELPVAVGLGVSSGEQAAQVARYADGVIVGSALVRALAEGGCSAVSRLAAELAEGVRRGGHDRPA